MAWLGTWENRRKISISNTNVDAILSNFPILVKISASSGTGSTDITDIFTELTGDANRKKIAITTSDGTTQCYVEIERFDFANSLAWFWVKVPSVAAASVTELYIYYDVVQADNTTYIGDTGDTPAQSVWDINFKLVMHMAQDPNGDVADAIKDSTINANHGTPAGSMTSADLVDGKIGKALDFDGINDYIQLATKTSVGAKTLEVVFYATDAAHAQATDVFLGETDSTNSSYGNWFRWDHSTHVISWALFKFVQSAFIFNFTTGALLANTDYYTAGVWDGTTGTNAVKIYVDGTVNVQDTASQAETHAPTYNTRIGADYFVEDRHYEGQKSEVRFSNTARPAAWIKATHYSNWDELVSFGAAEIFGDPVEISEDISVNSEFDTNRAGIDESIGINSELTYFKADSPISDDVSVNSEFACLVTDSPISEEASINVDFIGEYTGELSENASVNAAISTIHQQAGEVSEEISVNSEITGYRYFSKTIQDTLSAWDTLKWGWNKTISDSLSIVDTASKILGIPVKDWLTLTETETTNWNGVESISDSLYVVDISKVIQIYEDLIADGMAITDAVKLALRLIVTDILTCTDTVLNTGTFQHSIEDGMTLEDVAKRIFPKSISDSFAVTDTSLVDFLALLQVSDSFAATDTASRLLTINKTIADSLEALDAVTVQQLIQELIQDGLNIEVSIIIDGEVYECFVLNTSAFHVSIYSNYEFNSFAIDRSNNICYGCKSDGIYTLEGDSDNGTAFKSGIILPSSQFNSPNNKRFRKGFLAVEGNNVILKAETDNGYRTYLVTDTEASITRDLKGRSWQFSVEGFDSLDSIDLVPIILSRK